MLTKTIIKKSILAAALAASLPSFAADYYVVVPVQNRTATPGNIAIELNSFSLPAGLAGDPYVGFDFNQVLRVAGDPAFSPAKVRWSLSAGALPQGLTLGAQGLLNGTPVAAGIANFELTATYGAKSGARAYQVAVAERMDLKQFSGFRAWADGSYAATCNAYRNPSAPHIYQGAAGDGVYRISAAGALTDVYCDMTTNGGGYTVVAVIRDGRTDSSISYTEAGAGVVPSPGQLNGAFLPRAVGVALANLSAEVRIAEYGTSNVAWSNHPTVMGNLRQGRIANYSALDTYDPTDQWVQSQPGLAQFDTKCATASGLDRNNSYPSFYWGRCNAQAMHIDVDLTPRAAWHFSSSNGQMVVSYR